LNGSAPQRPIWIQTPSDHARALHPDGAVGLVTVARRVNGRWREHPVPAEALPEVVRLCACAPDAYLSQNRFRGPRRIAHLLALDALYADIDFQYVDALAHCSPEWILELAYETLSDAQMPAPSYAVATGRGLALVWLHEPVPRAALPRWRVCQRALYQALTPLGADRAALDPTRVLRLVGSENPKSGRLVTALTPVREVRSFEALADEILPLTRGELQALRQQRAATASQKPQKRKNSPPEASLTDLQTLLELR
jgi:hypothetical protein